MLSDKVIEARKAYNREYQREAYQRLITKLSRKKDADIIRHLNQQENVTEYIKDLIRRDMGCDKDVAPALLAARSIRRRAHRNYVG